MLLLFFITLLTSQVFADEAACQNHTTKAIENLDVMLGKWYQVHYWTGNPDRIINFTGCLELEFAPVTDKNIEDSKAKCHDFEKDRFEWNHFKVKTNFPFDDEDDITLFGYYNNITNVLLPCDSFYQIKLYSLDEDSQYVLWTHGVSKPGETYPAGGETLFAKTLPTHQELECIVKNIDILPNRKDGVFTCHV